MTVQTGIRKASPESHSRRFLARDTPDPDPKTHTRAALGMRRSLGPAPAGTRALPATPPESPPASSAACPRGAYLYSRDRRSQLLRAEAPELLRQHVHSPRGKGRSQQKVHIRPAAPSKQHAENGVRCPKVSRLRLFTGGTSERFRLVRAQPAVLPGSDRPGCGKLRPLV